MALPGKKHVTHCAIAYALDIFGDRWSLLIVRDLLLRGNRTYGEFLESGEGIATNVLADRLKGLEASRIIVKAPDPDNGRRNLYKLTGKGLDLAPLVLEIIRWSARHDPASSASKDTLARIESDRDGMISELRDGQLPDNPATNMSRDLT